MVVVEIQMSLSTAGIFTKVWGDVFATEAVCGERFQGKFGSLEITHSTQGRVSPFDPNPYPTEVDPDKHRGGPRQGGPLRLCLS